MNPDEYAKMDRSSRSHWFYVGKRDIVRYWIDRFVDLNEDDLLVDAGMGSGDWVAEMSCRCRVLGIDDHQESLDIARPRVEAVGGRVLRSSLSHIDLLDGAAFVVTMLDVLEHLDDDRQAVAEAIRITRPGGLIVVTVPSLMCLWSDWDEVLHHRRRYRQQELLAVLDQPHAQILHCAYFNFFVFPLVWAIRFWRRLFPLRAGRRRAEEKIPPHFVNELLRRLMVAPAKCAWFRPPLGVSLIAVVRRTTD